MPVVEGFRAGCRPPRGHLAAWVACGLVAAGGAPLAAQTLAGTAIPNRAAASFASPNGTPDSAFSNTVAVRAGRVGGLLLVPPRATQARPGETAVFSHTLTNTQNADDAFVLSATSAAGWPVQCYRDLNGDGQLDAGDVPWSGAVPLAAGASQPLLAVVLVPNARSVRGSTDTVTVTATGAADPTLGAAVRDTIRVPEAGVALALDKLVDQLSATPGDVLTYTIAYAATGSASATDVRVTDTVPAATRYVPGSLAWNGTALTDASGDDAGGFDVAAGVVTVALGDVPDGGSGTVTFRVTVGQAATAAIANVGAAAYGTLAGTDTAVSDTVRTALALATLDLAKELATPGPVRVGDAVDYVIRYGNTSATLAARDLVLSDTLPAGVTFASATPTAQVNGTVVTWTLGDLAPGASAEVRLTVRVTYDGLDTLTVRNSVALASLNAASTTATAAALEVTNATSAALTLSKAANVLDVGLGEVAPFTLALVNSGLVPLRDLVIADRLPSGARLVPGRTVGADSVTALGQTVTFHVAGPLAPGATHLVRYQMAIVSASEPLLRNSAVATAEGGLVRSSEALAWVRVRAAAPMETRAVIGKVWADLDGDGVQQGGEPGVAGVDVWTVDGEIATTDRDGRFSFRNLRPGRHAFRLDVATLPADYGVADEALADLELRDASGWTTPRVLFRVVPRSARLVGAHLPVAWTLLARPLAARRDTLRAPVCGVTALAASAPADAPIALRGVEFEINRAVLTAASHAILNEVAATLARYQTVRVAVAGHTDATGGAAHNMTLSRARAQAVRAYLVAAGIAPTRLDAQGYGPTRPVATNATSQGRARNRRVELTVLADAGDAGAEQVRLALRATTAGPCHDATVEFSAPPVVVTDVVIENSYAVELPGLALTLGPPADSTRVVVVLGADTLAVPAATTLPTIPAGARALIRAWSRSGADSVSATLRAGTSVEELRAEVHNPLRLVPGRATVRVRVDTLPPAGAVPPGGVVRALLALPEGRRDVVYVVPPAWAAVPGSLRDEGGDPLPVSTSRDPNGAVVLGWRAPVTPGRVASLDLRPAGASLAEVVTVPALRTAADREAERRRALVAGPGVELFAPADGTVLSTDRLFVGVRGEPGAPAALFDGDSLLAEATLRPDGVHDFIAVRLSAGPHRLRVRTRNSWSQERWDSLAVHVAGAPAAITGAGEAVRLTADGQAAATVRARVVDAWGVPAVQRPLVTVAAAGVEVTTPDADPSSVGPQVRPDAAGWVHVTVRAGHEVRTGAVHLTAGVARGTVSLEILPALQPLMITAVGRAGVGANPEAFGAITARGRLDERTAVVLSYDTRALDADRDAFGRVADPLEEAQYPLLGDAGRQRTVTASRAGFAARVERGFDWVAVGDVATQGFGQDLTLARYGRALTGAAARITTGAFVWQGFGSSTSRRLQQRHLRGAGIAGPYALTADVTPGTEVVALETRAYENPERVLAREVLVRFVDYQLDHTAGALLFKRPVPAADTYGNPIFIVVTYESDGGGVAATVAGLRATTDVGQRLGRGLRLDSLRVGGTWVHDGGAPTGTYQLAGGDLRLRQGALALGAEFARASSRDSSGVAVAMDAAYRLGAAVQVTGRWMHVGSGFHNPSGIGLRSRTDEIALGARASLAGSELQLDHGWQRFAAEGVSRSHTRAGVARTVANGLRVSAGLTADHVESGSAAIGSQAGEVEVAWQATPTLRVWSEARQLLSTQGPVAFPAHVGVGGRAQITSGLAVEARHRRVTLPGDSGTYGVTAVGLRTRLGDATEAWSSYQLAGMDGAHGAAVVGLSSRAHLGQDWTLSGSLERRVGLGRAATADPVRALPFLQQEEDYWAASLGGEWLPSERPYRGSARAELRQGALRSTRLVSAAGAVSFTPALALLSRQELLRDAMTLPSGNRDSRRLWSLWGLALRPTQSDRLNLLAKVEWLDVRDPQGGGVLANQGHEGRLILAGEGIYQPSARSEVAARYAVRRTRATLRYEDGFAQDVTAFAHFAGARAQFGGAHGLGVGAEGRVLYEARTGAGRYDIAPQVAYVPAAGIEVAMGYRFGSLRDPDFAANGGPGFFLTVGAQLTERSLAGAADFWLRRLAGRQ